MQTWKPMYGFENTHEINVHGEVRNIKRDKLLTPHPDKRGYLKVKPNEKARSIHRLVAQTFIPNPDNKPQVNHIDGNKQNNHISNLEWATQEENMAHGKSLGMFKNNSGKVFMEKQRPISCYTKQDEWVADFPSLQEAARHVNGAASNIHHALNGKIKTHKGFKWKYKDVN